MDSDYCDEKAGEALRQAGGNPHRAAQLLRDWVRDDLDLQAALLRPFLASLCALAVRRVSARNDRTRMERLRPAAEPAPVDMAEVVRLALGGKPGNTPPPPAAWTAANRRRQAQSIRAIAEAFQNKPGR